MKIRIIEADNGVLLQDVEVLETVVVGTEESMDGLYKEIGKRIFNEWNENREDLNDKDITSYGVVIDVKFKNIKKDPLFWKG